jgi:NAD(P)-dependent dehydrogenase (short-subunit alcohol dehydrogenase family)
MLTSILERFKLNGRTALVTGAGQGIGEAFAHALAQAGAKVAVVDLNGVNAEKVAGAINSYNQEVIAVTCDIRLPEQIESMVSKIANHFGSLHLAFNNERHRPASAEAGCL